MVRAFQNVELCYGLLVKLWYHNPFRKILESAKQKSVKLCNPGEESFPTDSESYPLTYRQHLLLQNYWQGSKQAVTSVALSL